MRVVVVAKWSTLRGLRGDVVKQLADGFLVRLDGEQSSLRFGRRAVRELRDKKLTRIAYLDRLEQAGICRHCHSRPARDGRSTCGFCSDSAARKRLAKLHSIGKRPAGKRCGLCRQSGHQRQRCGMASC